MTILRGFDPLGLEKAILEKHKIFWKALYFDFDNLFSPAYLHIFFRSIRQYDVVVKIH